VGEVVFYRMFGIDYYDAILTSGSFQESNIRTLEDLRGTKVKDVRVVGSTYMDSLKEKYDKEYKRTSIRTYLFRLEEKGYLKVEVRKRRAYINVIIDKESYKKEKAGEILEEWFDGSAKELISAISGNIKKDDTEELKGILDGFDFK
jgi:predicted transcriptional regulator